METNPSLNGWFLKGIFNGLEAQSGFLRGGDTFAT